MRVDQDTEKPPAGSYSIKRGSTRGVTWFRLEVDGKWVKTSWDPKELVVTAHALVHH